VGFYGVHSEAFPDHSALAVRQWFWMTSSKGRMSLGISAAKERDLKITLSLQPLLELQHGGQ
jgi:hypothetical protein